MRKVDRQATAKLIRQINNLQLNLGGVIEDINIRFEEKSGKEAFRREFEKIVEETRFVRRLTDFYLRCLTLLYGEVAPAHPIPDEKEDPAAIHRAIELKATVFTEGLITSLFGAFVGRHVEVALLEKQGRQNARLPKDYADEILRGLARRTWPEFPRGEDMRGKWPMLEADRASQAEDERATFISIIEAALEKWYRRHSDRKPTKAAIARIIYVEHDKYKIDSAPVVFSRKLKEHGIDFESIAARKKAHP
jgi:hypothetical protein